MVDLNHMKMYHSHIDHDQEVLTDIFFYHIPKTGGISLFTGLRFAMKMDPSVDNNKQTARKFLRYDENTTADGNLRYGLVASHRPFGAHRIFQQQFELITMVRDPVERLRSAFTYDCMRHNQPVSRHGFEALLKSEYNINRIVKQLSGRSRMAAQASPENLELAQETLSREFACYADITRLDAILEYYLSSRRLPNVVMDILNRTDPSFSFDISDYSDEIAERNRLDMDLVEWVRREPRLPMQTTRGPSLHPITVIITETGNSTRSEGHARPVPTETFLSNP